MSLARAAAPVIGAGVAMVACALTAFGSPIETGAGSFRETLDLWHDFYLLAGTAAVTLAGLLFVALSIHIDALIHDSRQHLLSLSRSTLSSFVFVLAVSLVLLAPGLNRRITGMSLVVFGVVFAVVMVAVNRRRVADEDPRLTSRHLRRRVRLPLMGYVLTVVVGACVFLGIDAMLYWMITIMCLLLGNAVGTSWELLVRVAQAKVGGETK